MRLFLTSAKLTGNPDKSGWSQIHDFVPDSSDKQKARGHLFAALSTKKSDEGVDFVIAGRELITRLHEEYYGNTAITPFNALKNAVTKVIDEFSESWGIVEIAAVAVVGDVVYSSAGGGGQVAIFRDGMLAKILESKEKKVVSASGHPQSDDLIIAGTSLFFDAFGEGVIKAAVEGGDPEKAVESLAPKVHSQEQNGSLGVVFINFSDEEPNREFLSKNTPNQSENKQNTANVSKESFFSKIASKLPKKPHYVKGEQSLEEISKRRKVSASVGVILVALLIVSIVFGARQKNQEEFRESYETELGEAQHNLDESLELFSINPERSRELFISSKNTADELAEQGIEDEMLSELRRKLEENEGNILGEFSLDPELFVDLSLLSQGFEGDMLVGDGETIFVFDRDEERIVEIEVETKRTETVAGPDDIEGAGQVAAYTDNVYILDGDIVYDLSDQKTRVIEGDWQGEVLTYSYAGNFYVLDKEGSQIYRYPATAGGFGEGDEWLSGGVDSDFSDAISWAIDGTIWVLKQDGDVLKFSLGNPQNFTASGVSPVLTNVVDIYTNEENEFVYLLEPDQSRMVVLTKEGDYKAQYVSDAIKNAREIVVSETHERIIMLTGDKLMVLQTRHL